MEDFGDFGAGGGGGLEIWGGGREKKSLSSTSIHPSIYLSKTKTPSPSLPLPPHPPHEPNKSTSACLRRTKPGKTRPPPWTYSFMRSVAVGKSRALSGGAMALRLPQPRLKAKLTRASNWGGVSWFLLGWWEGGGFEVVGGKGGGESTWMVISLLTQSMNLAASCFRSWSPVDLEIGGEMLLQAEEG